MTGQMLFCYTNQKSDLPFHSFLATKIHTKENHFLKKEINKLDYNNKIAFKDIQSTWDHMHIRSSILSFLF